MSLAKGEKFGINRSPFRDLDPPIQGLIQNHEFVDRSLSSDDWVGYPHDDYTFRTIDGVVIARFDEFGNIEDMHGEEIRWRSYG